MKLTIVYDNEIYQKNHGLKSDWGFACLIETNNDTILFDTGAKGEILIENMNALDIDISKISKIVISHEHWDHNGGLESIVSFCNDLEVYRIEDIDTNKKIQSTIIQESQKIANNVNSTGRLPGSPVDEQSLILYGKNGVYVLVGCSHSGVENILRKSTSYGRVLGLIGGLHGFDNFPSINTLDVICPCHCTKYKSKLKELYKTKIVEGGVGRILEI